MILKYKGYNENWVYEEADIVSHATVFVGKETRDYRKDGIRYNLFYSPEQTQGRDKYKADLSYTKEMHEAVDRLIKNETQCSDDIIYHIDNPFDQLENVVVVILRDKNKNTTYVFERGRGIYILNNNGQTVQRIG